MTTIVANDLKIQGVGAFKKALAHATEAVISVRGKMKYVVIPMKEYSRIREQEILNSYEQAKKDIKAGRFHIESVKDHMKRIKNG